MVALGEPIQAEPFLPFGRPNALHCVSQCSPERPTTVGLSGVPRCLFTAQLQKHRGPLAELLSILNVFAHMTNSAGKTQTATGGDGELRHI